MKTIQLYSDETKPDNKSFLIYSMIYGTPEQIEILNQKIIKSLGHLDSNNKGLHSNKLNEKKRMYLQNMKRCWIFYKIQL